MTKHFVYCTTNLVNGKIYVGVHSTYDMNDGYIGNSITSDAVAKYRLSLHPKNYFMKAVVKYGYENFECIPFAYFDTREDAEDFESKIVDEEFVKSKDTYNSTLGGGKTVGLYNGNAVSKKEYKARIQSDLRHEQFEYINIYTPTNKRTRIVFYHKECGKINDQFILNHLRRYSCTHCKGINISKSKRNTKRNFLQDKSVLFLIENGYCFNKFVYVNNHTKSIVIHPIHGDFLVSLDKIQNRGLIKPKYYPIAEIKADRCIIFANKRDLMHYYGFKNMDSAQIYFNKNKFIYIKNNITDETKA